MEMGPGLRKFMLATHITLSVGWVGSVIAYLALDVTVATSRDVPTLRGAYLAMELVAWWAIVPLAFAALVTGLVMSLGGRWGLFRHYWVLFSFLLNVLALAVLLAETRVIGDYAGVAADPRSSSEELRALGDTLPHSIGGLVVLVVILWLNVYKPRGMTRYGWRRQRQERLAAQRDVAAA